MPIDAYANLTHNQALDQVMRNSIQSQMHSVSWVPPQGTPLQFNRQTAGNIINDSFNTASLLPFGFGLRAAAAPAERFLPGLAKSVAANVGLSVPATTGQIMANPQNMTPAQIAKAYAENAAAFGAMGAGLHVAGAGVGKAAQASAKGIKVVSDKLGQAGTADLNAPLSGPHITPQSKAALDKLNATEAQTEQLLQQQGVKIKSPINGFVPENQRNRNLIGSGADSVDMGGGKPPVEPPIAAPEIPPGQKQRGYITSIKTKPNDFSPTVQGAVDSNYTPQTHADWQSFADSFAGKTPQDLNKAFANASDLLDKKAMPRGQEGQSVTAIGELANRLDQAGQHDMSTSLLNKLAEHGTDLGQGVNAFALALHRTPAGLINQALRAWTDHGVKYTPEMEAQARKLVQDVSNAPDAGTKAMAGDALANFVNDKIPRGKWDTAMGLWRAGLLTGPETVAKIITSHVTGTADIGLKPGMALADKALASKPLTGVMKFLNRGNKDYQPGQRTVTVSPIQDIKAVGTGTVRGGKALGVHLKTGQDLPHTGGFGGQMIGQGSHQTNFEKFIYRIHGTFYKPSYAIGYDLEMANQRRLASQMFGGDAKKMEDFLQNPDGKAMAIATDQAAKLTMQNLTEGGKLAQQLQHIKIGPIPVGKWLAPFSRIPAALGTKGLVDYTPLGTLRAGRTLYDGIAHGKFDQRKFVESMVRSGAGGSAMVWGGSTLMSNGRMTLQEPQDPKEKSLWDLQGKTRNSIYVGGHVTKNADGTYSYDGGKWLSMNAMGPMGLALGVGGAWGRALQEGQTDPAHAATLAIAAGAKLLADQPYMKGITGPANAITNPVQYAKGYLNSSVTSFIPAGIQQVARGFDQYQRGTPQGLGEAVAQGIPGLRQNTPERIDLYGNKLPGSNPSNSVLGGLAGTINPFYPSPNRNAGDPVTQEFQRLYNNLGSSNSPSMAIPNKSVTINGQPVKMTSQQYSDYLTGRGQLIYPALHSLITSPQYAALSDADRANAIDKIMRAGTSAQEIAQLGSNQKPSGTTKGLQANNLDTSKLAVPKGYKPPAAPKTTKVKAPKSTTPKVAKAKSVKLPSFKLKAVKLTGVSSKAPSSKLKMPKVASVRIAKVKPIKVPKIRIA